MLKEGTNTVGDGASTSSRVYDTCQSTVCMVYYHVNSTYLCSSCDASSHASNHVASRKSMCGSAKRVNTPPLFALLVTLTFPLQTPRKLPPPRANSSHFYIEQEHGFLNEVEEEEKEVVDEFEDEVEVASWLLSHPLKNNDEEEEEISISSMDIGIVPKSTISDISMFHSKSPLIGTSDLFPPLPMPSHLTPLDRETRVLRYMEKKKTRKFEKKIRYASRKAYTKTRSRIKGRFAKRIDVEAKVDQMLSIILFIEVGSSIFPSF
ncbi:Zinc finger protein CONSTANS-LIKE 2, partial [Mucuna pruriens]